METEFVQQYISLDELKSQGLSLYKINKLTEAGILQKINRRFYENLLYKGEINDFYAVTAYAPKGVVCLLSAAVYHGLSTHRPFRIDVALPRRSRVPDSPEWPSMDFYLFSPDRYETGITKINEDGNVYYIYDMEKTVCDIMIYRNKIGFEAAIEVLRSYLSNKNRNINRLMMYAEKLQVAPLLRQYLEVML